MTTTLQKLTTIDTSVSDKAPLTEVLNHIDLEMKQQTDEQAAKAVVSHVPVSINAESRSSSSTLCSISSGDTVSTTNSPTHSTPITESKKPNEIEIVSSRIDARDSTPVEKIHTPSTVPLSDVSRGVSPSVSRPAKKARTVSNCSPVLAPKVTPSQQNSPILLLARDEDESHLSPLHVFVRKQIEVFSATATELSQPAPGRKQPIQLHQVGLRCIHCRNHVGERKKRVKRAVCYPSAVGRIYHSVSDMKFDHFTHCQHVPLEVRETFETLKAEGKKDKQKNGKNKSNSTAKYYCDSALQMGLVDGPGGTIYMKTGPCDTLRHPMSTQKVPSTPPTMPSQMLQAQNMLQQQQQQKQREELTKLLMHQQQPSLTAINSATVASMLFPPMNPSLLQSLLVNAMVVGANAQKSIDMARARDQKAASQPNPRKRPLQSSPTKVIVSLAAPQDEKELNPLHCFVRKHVELFSADQNDTEAPCPGRKTKVTLGQVGIRCKHCSHLQKRIKRAVCYPPSIDGIYHAVSNMKFDHFGICPCLPEDAKKELEALRTNKRNSGSSNTAKYYRKSAVSKGLVDTPKGIRFVEATTVQPQNVAPLAHCFPAPTGISALMVAAASRASI